MSKNKKTQDEQAAEETMKTAEAAAEAKEEQKEAAPPTPEQLLEEARLKLEAAEKKHLLLLADMENLRKRCMKDMESTRYNTMADTITPFLQVFDHFGMAVKASEQSDNLKMLLDGLKMIHGEFDKAFQELGVECIDAVGKDFDPNVHEAVSQEASETVPAGKVIRQWNCGYKTGSRLLKPAMVVVSSGKPEETGKE
ncbi:MAG: nucleotide exchange factor GrpE [Lentisphaeria bacterium]|nr:nucleotide exchange factor GrpE [Lentisphaeria bacterium]